MIVNPVLWELGHVAWFQERWCLRLRPDESLADSLLEGSDALYDSAKVAHDTRWDLPLPSLEETLDFQGRVLERVLARLEREPDDPWFLYFVQPVERRIGGSRKRRPDSSRSCIHVIRVSGP